jgi:cytochrome c oxidase subunit 3
VKARRALYLDVSALPHHAFGSRDLMWWGTMGFMLIEGSMFAVLLATYGYLYGIEETWPPAPFPAPDLLWGTVNTLILFASLWPNRLLHRATEAQDLRRLRFWLLVMDAFALAFMVVRCFELASLNVRWDSNAYGSILWLLLGFHTFHLLTDQVESYVLTVLVFWRPDGRRLVDVSEDCLYWDFVIWSWLPIYVAVYWLPRWA